MTKQDVKQMDDEKQHAVRVHKNVYCALVAAQREMGPLVKGSENPHFKSKYADLADLVLAVREPLNRNGLTFFHQIVRADGQMDMRTLLVHGESDTRIECDVPLIVQKQDMQGMKSATTYAKRIGLESVTGVAPEDDDGNAAAKAAPPPFDAIAASKRIRGKLAQATDLDDLRDRWKSEADTIGEVRHADAAAFAEIERAKNDRKAALEQSDDLDGDGTPDFDNEGIK
ncbi:MAG: ERF family protein [Paracoccaceae bacterium]